MLKEIRHIGIVVNDLDIAVKFYLKLGFKICSLGNLTSKICKKLYGNKGIKGITYIKLKIPSKNCMLELYCLSKNSNDYNKYSLTHISFTVENINVIWKLLKHYRISKEIVLIDNHKLFFARDPDRNLLELVQPLIKRKK